MADPASYNIKDANGNTVTFTPNADPAKGGKQDAGNATLASILAKLVAAPATEAKQDAAAALLQGIIDAIGDIPGGGGGGGGDASAANQVTGNAILTAIAGYVDGLEGKDYATQATLAAVLAKIIAAPATEAKQDTLIAKDFATQATLAAVLAKLIAAPATEAKQDTMIARAVAQLGARTVVQSPAINIATDDPQIGTKVTAVAALGAGGAGILGWLSQIWDRLNSAPAAGENHIGQVGGHTVYIDVTLSLDTSAYASGDVLADTQVVTNAMRVNDIGGVLQSVTVIDQDDQKAAFYIYLLSANQPMGTENAAPSISDANALEILGPPIAIAVADYYDLGGVSIAGRDGIGKVVKPAAGTRNLYVAVVNGTGTPTYTAAGVKLRLGFLQD